jgi:hypothetical protein
MAEPLKTELETYERKKSDLIADAGKFALIKGDAVLGIYESYADALKIGYEKCGLNPFLVKKIQVIEPINLITRDLALSCLTSQSS